MPARNSYDYALVRLVPHVERGEYINAGVILFCRTRHFLGALIHLDEQRARWLSPPTSTLHSFTSTSTGFR